jgi:hypothetical protein
MGPSDAVMECLQKRHRLVQILPLGSNQEDHLSFWGKRKKINRIMIGYRWAVKNTVNLKAYLHT